MKQSETTKVKKPRDAKKRRVEFISFDPKTMQQEVEMIINTKPQSDAELMEVIERYRNKYGRKTMCWRILK